ncbi:alanine--tRNA ligase, partial [Patescibacteria group bacterium]|nr:alanine--tRNA ligase [Patescibacteria group bacterium]
MNSNKIREQFINYFKKNKHKVFESSSLWPQDDPSVLLTIAGMQQFKPFFMGILNPEKELQSTSIASVQRCFRTSDIEEVGDKIHNTFFEMLGNFSFGQYFKDEAIKLAWNFLIKKLKINKKFLWTTYFKGEKGLKKDIETFEVWQKYIDGEKIIGFGKKENWWGPPGKTGPCGPSSEIHYDLTGQPCQKGNLCKPNCQCGRFIELWNLVFMQYHINSKGTLNKLPKNNIDTGLGLERLAMILQKKDNIFATDLFNDLVNTIIIDKSFGNSNDYEDVIRSRIAADHMKGSVFLLADNVYFSNKEQGYVLRKIFRRALDQYLHSNVNLENIVDSVCETYKKTYPHLIKKKQNILSSLQKELNAYKKVLEIDVNEIVSKINKLKHQTKRLALKGPSSRKLTAQEAFVIYSTYGLSPERLKRKGFTFDDESFKKLIIKHQQLSRDNTNNKFGGHGLNSKEWSNEDRQKIIRLHTATHLLHQALRDVLGLNVKQQGSDINPERLRFDFEHSEKLTDDEKQKIENIVNEKIKQNLPVTKKEMKYLDAIKDGALAFFKEKYPEIVNVYSVGQYSKELCGGPHVKNSGEI